MSECYIATRRKGKTQVSMEHYAAGVMDHRKYHQKNLEFWQDQVGGKKGYNPDYVQERITFHEAAIRGEGKHTASVSLGGCEEEAAKEGCWIVNSPEAEVAFVRKLRRYEDLVPKGTTVSDCSLLVDFDTKIVTIDPDNGMIDWQDYLPDGWTAILEHP